MGGGGSCSHPPSRGSLSDDSGGLVNARIRPDDGLKKLLLKAPFKCPDAVFNKAKEQAMARIQHNHEHPAITYSFIYLVICLFIYLFICLCIYLFIYSFIYLFIQLFIHLLIHLTLSCTSELGLFSQQNARKSNKKYGPVNDSRSGLFLHRHIASHSPNR